MTAPAVGSDGVIHGSVAVTNHVCVSVSTYFSTEESFVTVDHRRFSISYGIAYADYADLDRWL